VAKYTVGKTAGKIKKIAQTVKVLIEFKKYFT
jgi:hypothetical protein